jgi:hypothetical protein
VLAFKCLKASLVLAIIIAMLPPEARVFCCTRHGRDTPVARVCGRRRAKDAVGRLRFAQGCGRGACFAQAVR